MAGTNGLGGGSNGIGLGQGRGPFHPAAFYVPFETPDRYVLTGVTKDSAGAILGGCAVLLFETATNVIKAISVSGADGNYLVDGTLGLTYFIVWYKAGAPDVAGTSVNTLVATPA